MFKKSHTTRIMFLGILFLVITAAMATYVYFKPVPPAQASPLLDETYQYPLNPDSTYRLCTISDIYVVDTHIHVRCTTPDPAPNVYYYSYYGDAAHSLIANRFLVLLNTALALNKNVNLRYSTIISPPSWCPIFDCRLLVDMWIQP